MSRQSEQKVLHLRQKPHIFLRIVRELSEDSKNIKWSTHARERFQERSINNRMAMLVIQKGEISGEIVAGKSAGEWKAKLTYPIPGVREIGVIIILVKETRILVKTVEWED